MTENSHRVSKISILDILLGFIFVLIVLLFFLPIFSSGQIIFSDLDFGTSSDRYLEIIVGTWNARWSTPTLFNMPRVWFVLPLQLISTYATESGPFLLKSILIVLIATSGIHCRVLCGYLIKKVAPAELDYRLYIAASWFTAVVYALNPWVIIRIQHIYLLVGYAFLPLLLVALFKLFSSDAPESIRKSILKIFAVSIFYAMSATSQHYFLFGAIIVGLICVGALIRWLWLSRDNRAALISILINWTLYIFLIGLFAGLLMFYWLGPYIFAILTDSIPSQNHVNYSATIDLFSRHSSLQEVITGESYWWPMFPLDTLPTLSKICGIIIFVVSLNVALISRWRWWLLSSLIILVVLSTGTTYQPLRALYLMLVFDLPNPLGLVFRDPNKLVGIMYFSLSINLSLSVVMMTKFARKYTPIIFGALGLCWFIWILPWHHQFVEGFYVPVDLPQSYHDLYEFLDTEATADPDSRVLYLPTTEHMRNADLGFATPTWNTLELDDSTLLYRATPDFAVINSPMNTLYQNEGATVSVGAYFQYVQYLLEQGYSETITPIFQMAGVDFVVFQYVYDYDLEQQEAMLNTLLDANLEHESFGDGIYVFRVDDSLSQLETVPNVLYTSSGYDTIHDLLSALAQPADTGFVFTSQQPTEDYHNIRVGDFLDAPIWQEFVLSNLPEDVYYFPGDWSIEITGWEPNSNLNHPSFAYVLAVHNLPGFINDFDFDGGSIYAYQKYHLQGHSPPLSIMYDQSALADLFLTDNASRLTTQAESINFSGRLNRPNWEVFNSSSIALEDQTGLRFSALLDATNVLSFHVKILFFDSTGNQIGVDYITPERLESAYSETTLEKLIPVPDQSSYAYLQVLTKAQDRNMSTSWQLSQMQLEDVSKQAQPVSTSSNISVMPDIPYRIFIRTFESAEGGSIEVDVNGDATTINTLIPQKNHFTWHDLGIFTTSSNNLTVTLENIAGFNVINNLVVIPDEQLSQIDEAIRQQAMQTNPLMFVDAASEMDWEPQDNTIIPITNDYISRSTYFSGGKLKSEIYLPREGVYDFTILHEALQDTQNMTVLVDNREMELVETANERIADVFGDNIVATQFSFETSTPDTVELVLRMTSENTLISLGFTPDDGEKLRIEGVAFNNFVYEPTEFQNWKIVQTEDIPITEETYALAYDLQATALEDLHMKILFFDEEQDEIDVQYIGDSCRLPDGLYLCTTFESIIIPPLDATTMRVQILGHTQSNQSASLELGTFRLVGLSEFFSMDGVLIERERSDSQQDVASASENTDRPDVVVWRESPSGFWRADNAESLESLPINGVNQGFWVTEGKATTIFSSIEGIYLFGSIVSLASLLLMVTTWIYQKLRTIQS